MKAFVGFAGFGGVDIALREFGFDVLAVEIDDDIAQVNRDNGGGDVITTDILDLNPDDYIGYNLAHFSPPCISFSRANASGEESTEDIALAQWIARFIAVVQPQYFTLENVWSYRKSRSWAIIARALSDMCYGINWWHLNAADFGIPQRRKRMIAIARCNGDNIVKPMATHQNPKNHNAAQMGMFEQLPPWRGWYAAIEDLIPDLPETRPADWQINRLPRNLKTMLIPVNGENSSRYRGFIVASQNTSNQPITTRYDHEPMFTVNANAFEKRSPQKAFIIGGQYQTPNDGSARTVQNKRGNCPVWTITASEKGDTRAYVEGKWVSMTPRCLARFQDFPDWFKLPENRVLACRGIGNAVPGGLYRSVLNSLDFERSRQCVKRT